jgi:hypothetical protein
MNRKKGSSIKHCVFCDKDVVVVAGVLKGHSLMVKGRLQWCQGSGTIPN